MHRDLHFALERAVTNVALRTVSTALVIEEMHSSSPTIYVDYTGYDAISHHCGPEREEAIDALGGIDRAVGSLMKAARHARRWYRLVVLSDHGQCLGPTFRQRWASRSSPVIAALLPRDMTVLGTTGTVESAGTGRRIAAEFVAAPAWVRCSHGGCAGHWVAPRPRPGRPGTWSCALPATCPRLLHEPARSAELRDDPGMLAGPDRGADPPPRDRSARGQDRRRSCAGRLGLKAGSI